MPSTVLILQIVGLLGSGLAAGRLFENGLFRIYPALSFYLAFRLLYGSIPLFLDNTQSGGDAYFTVYVYSQPIVWMFYLLMVREVYGLALASHRGLQTLGRWAMYISVAMSVTISVLSILQKITPKLPQKSKTFGYFLAIDRGINFALVVFILLILFFLSRYPVPLSRNLVRHSCILFVYFLTQATVILIRSIYGPGAIGAAVNNAVLAIGTILVLSWLFLITPAGEQIRKVVGIAPEHEQRILQQLDALNATLLKISRN